MRTPTKGQLVKAIQDIVDAEDARVRARDAAERWEHYAAHLEEMISRASNMIGPYVQGHERVRDRYVPPKVQ
jgi:hypothetical protein